MNAKQLTVALDAAAHELGLPSGLELIDVLERHGLMALSTKLAGTRLETSTELLRTLRRLREEERLSEPGTWRDVESYLRDASDFARQGSLRSCGTP